MSYGTIYTLPFRSRKEDVCLVEIQKEGYTGRVIELTGSGEAPFSVEIADDDFLYTPVRFSTAAIRVVGGDHLQPLLYRIPAISGNIQACRVRDVVWLYQAGIIYAGL